MRTREFSSRFSALPLRGQQGSRPLVAILGRSSANAILFNSLARKLAWADYAEPTHATYR